MDEEENVKTYNQSYLFEALSFTEAEARTYGEMEAHINTEFKVSNIRVENLSEVLPNETGEHWFKCKLTVITVDEEKETERRSNSYLLVQADDVVQAYHRLSDSLRDVMYDFEIPSVALSPILDVFPYFGEEQAEEQPKKESADEDSSAD